MLPLSSILEKINPLEKAIECEYYLCLVISDKWVKSALWAAGDKEEPDLVLGSSESWGNQSAEELIVAADASIAAAVTKLSKVTEERPSKVILGLPEHWVKGVAIAKEKLEILQAVCQKLGLKPLGFVVTPEAVAHYLKIKEGGLPGTILVNPEETEIIVSLITQGKFLGSKIVGRSDNVALDVEEGLIRFEYSESLPNRILVVGSSENGDIEEIKQVLVGYPWVGPGESKKVNFLQLPKVETLEPDFEIGAVVAAGCRELGWRIGPLETETAKDEEPVVETDGFEENIEEFSGEDFGFIKDKDILLVNPEPEAEEPPVAEESVSQETQTSPKVKPKAILAALAQYKNRLHFACPKFDPRSSLIKSLVIVLLVLGGVLSLFIFGFWRLARAELKIYVKPQVIEKEFKFVVSPNAETVNLKEMTVPARKARAEVSKEQSAAVLGKKTVGDRATGEVVVYNGTDKAKTFPKGTVLKGPGGLKFVLDQEVTVASKTADLNVFPPVERWGEAGGKIKAGEIGAQYNMAANSLFNFEGVLSSFIIKNPSAFSGGTSREIQAVSQEDRVNLQKVLVAELKNKATGEIRNKIPATDKLLIDSVVLESKTDHFDRELGDEVSTITLKTTATFTALYVTKEDFEALVQKVVAATKESGYQSYPFVSESNFSLSDEKKGIYTARVKQKFLPEIETDKVSRQLRAKSLSQAESLLGSFDRVVGVEIGIRPRLFSCLKIFPLKKENILITVEAI